MSAEADTNPPTETPKKEKKEPYIRTDFPLSFFVHRSKVLGHVLLSIMSFTALVLIGISMGVPWMRKDQYNNEITDTATGAVTSTGLWYRKNLYAYKLTMNAATLPRNNENKLFDFRFGFSDFCYRVETRLKALFSFLIVSIALSFVTFILSIVNAAMGGGVRTAWHTDDHIEEEEAFIRRNPRHTSTASELNQLGDNNNNNNNNEPQEEEEEEAQQHPVKTKRCNHAYNVHIATTIFGCFAFSALTITISFAWNLFLYSFLYPECLAEADNLKTSAVESHLSSLSGTPLTTASALIQVPQQVFDNSYHSQFYEVYVGLGFAMTAWALMGAGVLLSHYHFSFELDPLRLLSRLLSIYYTTTMISFLFVVVSCPIPHFFLQKQ
ncbi:hypothetical protein ADEAN_001034900 [Angomonas deanei]|uniref:Uncharacterized protein n=1 Tax=Angomonas deanei TaxID=59799 RepID=A0A7G2CU39_9TRYP|nr:hypothetical protein ADEAN_001034900 [Angomonas deanei]